MVKQGCPDSGYPDLNIQAIIFAGSELGRNYHYRSHQEAHPDDLMHSRCLCREYDFP